MLEHAAESPGRRKELARHIPKDVIFADPDGKPVRVKEYLATEGLLTGLVATELYQTVVEGAQPAKCVRDIIPQFQMKSNKLTLNVNPTGTYAQKIKPGAEIRDDSLVPITRDYEAFDYAQRSGVTKQTIDDGLFGLVESQTRGLGAAIENRLNQDVVSHLLENSGAAYDAGTTSTLIGLPSIVKGMATASGNGMNPDAMIMSPAFAGQVGLSLVPSGGYFDVNSFASTGKIGNLLGLKTGLYGGTDTSATYTWGYGTDNYIGALILDTQKCGFIGMRQDIQVDEFDEKLRQVMNYIVTMRAGYNYSLTYGTTRLQY